MRIKKIGHCCLLIHTHTAVILTDPGMFSSEQDMLTGIDIVLITHEHADHLHIDSLKKILKNNPDAEIITNSSVGNLLSAQGIPHRVLEGGNTTEIASVHLAACDAKHEEIFEEVGQVQNTGYMIDRTFFYPGDAYANPGVPVSILALPVAGPWCKIAEAVRYTLSIRPQKVFPVHDGMLEPSRIGGAHAVPEQVLTKHGIEFVRMCAGDEKEF